MNQPKLDAFYTKKPVARDCINFFLTKTKNLLKEKMCFVEPSAGNGSFSSQLPKNSTIPLDIAPADSSIKKQDFFEFIHHCKNKEVVTIGNPPFGRRSKMAIKFFNHAAMFSSWIAFIVPFQFKKYSVHSKLDKNFQLIATMNLKKNSFLSKGKNFNLNCCFQIWTKRKTPYPNQRILQSPPIKHADLELFQYNNTPAAKKYFNKAKYKWDIAIYRQGFYFKRNQITFTQEKQLNAKIQYIFIKFNKSRAKKIIAQIDFRQLANKNTSTPGFGKADLVAEYIVQDQKMQTKSN